MRLLAFEDMAWNLSHECDGEHASWIKPKIESGLREAFATALELARERWRAMDGGTISEFWKEIDQTIERVREGMKR